MTNGLCGHHVLRNTKLVNGDRDRGKKGNRCEEGGDLKPEADLAGDRLSATDESESGFAGREIFGISNKALRSTTLLQVCDKFENQACSEKLCDGLPGNGHHFDHIHTHDGFFCSG